VNINANTLILIGLVGGVFYLFKSGKLQAINPVNNQNVISEGANSALGLSEQGSSIGSFIFDLFNPEFDPNAPPQI